MAHTCMLVHYSACTCIIALELHVHVLLLSTETHVIHVEKRSSSSGSCEDGRGGGAEETSKKRPRVIGPTMPPQSRRDVPEQVCHD